MWTAGGNIVKYKKETSTEMYSDKISKFHILTSPTPGAGDVREVWATLRRTYSLSLVTISLVGWLVVLRINVDLAIFQPYLDLEYYQFGYPNFQYNTWYVSGTELGTSRRTDDPITRYPSQIFLPGDLCLYSYCNLALMQALTIYLITRYDIAVIIFIWFMFFDSHYNERTWYLHFQIGFD